MSDTQIISGLRGLVLVGTLCATGAAAATGLADPNAGETPLQLQDTVSPAGDSAELAGVEEQLEVLISDPEISYRDPEWSSRAPELAYCGADERIRIVGVDPGDGSLRLSPGDTVIELGQCRSTGNGAEWGFSRGADLLSWPVVIDGEDHIAMALRPLGKTNWREINPLPRSGSLRGPFPIKNTSGRPWLIYNSGASGSITDVYARPAMKPYAEVFIQQRTKFPKWIPGSNEVIYTTSFGSVEAVDVIDQSRREILPSYGESLKNPILWQTPETSSPAIVLINDTRNCIQVYQLAPAVLPSKEICTAQFAQATELRSPEVFVLKNRSYVSFAVTILDSSKQDIYVASAIDLPGESPVLERTSSAERRIRKDPEPFVGDDRAFIYFTASSNSRPDGPRGIWMTQFFGRQ